MSDARSHTDSLSASPSNQEGSTLVSLVAAKAGREVVWVLIAGAFCVVEALVFLTELPASKLFHRREPTKVAGHGRR
ncbi:MAG: hypothetical protein NTV51_04095 [Verrucomicrobia bacterium]|nr:hypothetical protein [Verrucomicrobiota bacterium]